MKKLPKKNTWVESSRRESNEVREPAQSTPARAFASSAWRTIQKKRRIICLVKLPPSSFLFWPAAKFADVFELIIIWDELLSSLVLFHFLSFSALSLLPLILICYWSWQRPPDLTASRDASFFSSFLAAIIFVVVGCCFGLLCGSSDRKMRGNT